MLKLRIFSEKCMVLCVFVISISTMLLIMMNLPADVQRAVQDESKLIHKVFIPENLNNQIHHANSHQHPAPPLFNQNSEDKYLDEPKDDKKSVDYEIPDLKETHLVNMEMTTEYRRDFIKKMALFGWQMYERYAWGENELKPVSKVGHSAGIFGSSTKLGATIVDGLDTMYLMGFVEEVARGREWIEKHFSLKVNADVSVFEVNIRFIGGFLSMFTLTKDKVNLN